MVTQFYEIYRRDGQIYGTPIRSDTTYRLRLEYENCFNLPGQTACFFLVSRDDTIRREEAIVFAQGIATNRLVHIHIDLSQMITIRTYSDGTIRQTK